eukprot:3194245-Amphidinium_carterae.1
MSGSTVFACRASSQLVSAKAFASVRHYKLATIVTLGSTSPGCSSSASSRARSGSDTNGDDRHARLTSRG